MCNHDHCKRAVNQLKAVPFGTMLVAVGSAFSWLAVGSDAVNDDGIIRLLASWRSENMVGFPREEVISFDGTRNWVREQLVEREDRILFFLMDRNARLVAHAGFSNIDFDAGVCEFDNIIKGDKSLEKGSMSRACRLLIDWASSELKMVNLWVKCFYDNFPAVALYHSLGFKPYELQPIRRIQEATCKRWVDATNSERFERFNLLLVNDCLSDLLSKEKLR